jgi:hypothetical protein
MNNQENTLYVLNELSSTESADLEYSEIDVFYESENGTEGAAQYDMPTIAKMAIEAINTQSKRIAELEKDKAFLLTQRFMGNTIVSTDQGLSDAIKAHNIEQQIKGVMDYEDCLSSFAYDAEEYCDKLRKQANEN